MYAPTDERELNFVHLKVGAELHFTGACSDAHGVMHLCIVRIGVQFLGYFYIFTLQHEILTASNGILSFAAFSKLHRVELLITFHHDSPRC